MDLSLKPLKLGGVSRADLLQGDAGGKSQRGVCGSPQREFILKLTTEYLAASDRDEATNSPSQDYRASVFLSLSVEV